MINTGPTVALVALSTLCTAVFVGLGFLPRPSRAAAVWSCAFFGLMITSYAWVAADGLDSNALRGVSSGLMLAMTALVWAGLRVRRRAPGTHWVFVLGYLIASPVLLFAASATDFYITAVRVDFAVSAVFAALILVELVRLGPAVRDEVLPLAIMSGAFVIFAVLNLVQEAVRLTRAAVPPTDEQFQLLRDLNVIGALLLVVCASFTLLLLTRERAVPAAPEQTSFDAVATDRLRRAEASDDKWWSVLVIRLDDPLALREASSTNAFEHITSQFASDVQAALPAEADVVAVDATEFRVLLPRPEGAVRQLLARLLERIAAAEPDAPLAVRLSASVGWAGVDAVGYELSALTSAAEDAATRAQELGGDRWERVTAVV